MTSRTTSTARTATASTKNNPSPSTNPLSLGLHFQLLQRAGSLISSLDALRHDLSGIGELAFPQIIVVGEESSGKSSVLERIAMLSFFPRSKRMCTRMPIKLQLKHKSPTQMAKFCEDQKSTHHDGVAFVRARTEWVDRSGTEQWSPFQPIEGVEKLVCDTMDRAVKTKNAKLTGVIEDVVVVEVTSSSVPNLTLIDLPGTCIVARPGEPDDIMRSTQSLVEKYLRQEHTLVLLVMPANTRMHNYLPLTLIKNHRKLNNTIGVLTKADMAENGRYGDDRFLEFREQLSGRSEDYIPLINGYVAVRNRDTEGSAKRTLGQASIEEVEWFKRNLPGFVEKKLASSQVLVGKLVEMMCTYVENTWATQAKHAINARLAQLKLKLDALGPLRTVDGLPLLLHDVGISFSVADSVVANTLVVSRATLGLAPTPRSSTSSAPSFASSHQGATYHCYAPAIKARCREGALTVLREAKFVSPMVRQLLADARKKSPAKLDRFKCFFDTLEAVLTAQSQARAYLAEERLVRELAIVEVICDIALGREGKWSESDIQSYFETLLTTVIYEEVLLPLQTTMCSTPPSDTLISAMISQLASCSSSTPSAAKAQLIAECTEVAKQRAHWDAETTNLHSALASIASLQASSSKA